jgi:hypothetical protein
MKKIIFLTLLFNSFVGFSQFNKNAPWIKTDSLALSGKANINEIVNGFDKYWENKDFKKKGSGYKPFMRWEYHWRNKTDEQGFLMTPAQMWTAFNQKNDRKSNRNGLNAPASNWQPIGPFANALANSTRARGRVNTVLVDPVNPNTIYMGTPAGGIWKSLDNGVNWIPLSDNLPQIGVSGIAVDPNNTNIIYISTGDCDANDTYSIGVMKTIDGGVTWNTTGLSFATTDKSSGDIFINPNDSNMLWVATSDGIYKTTNAGTTWTLSQAGDFSQGRIRLKVGDPNTVYAVSNNRFYRSTNAGTTFSIASPGLPFTSNRMLLDVTAANPNTLYILSTNGSSAMQGIYKSVNGGSNWTKTSGTNDYFDASTQSWYDLAFAVSQTNELELYVGCLNIWKSTNGGTSGTKINDWNVYNPVFTHADIHYLRFYGNKLYCGSDGGIYVSDNNGASFSEKTGEAQISQAYKIAVSKQTASKVVIGLQDNGGYGYNNNLWKSYHGGDGMDNAIDPTNSNLYYGFLYYGQTLFISNNAGSSLTSTVAGPTGQQGNWVTPMTMNKDGQLYAGWSNFYKLTPSGWVQQNTGISPFGSGNLDVIATDPNNTNNIFVTNGINLYKSTNAGVSFALVYSANSSITSVNVHAADSNIIYITTEGINGLAMKSTNGGTAFTSISQGLPNIGKNVIIHQGRNSNNPLYVGTSLGVYYRDDTMSQFEPFDTNLPNVSVTDLDINLEDNKILAATYGRGVWIASIPIIAPTSDIKIVDIQSPTSSTVGCDGNIVPQIQVKNNGMTTISNVAITYAINTTNYTYNWVGNINADETTLITLPSANLPKGSYTLSVTSTIVADAYADNNTATKVFYVNEPGTLNTTNTFETASDELLEYNEGSASGLWTRGVRTGTVISSGTNNVYATSLTGTYPDKTKSYLVSKCYNLSQIANPDISFKLAFDLEINWDVVYVEYSTNFGQSWQVLGTQGPNWYNSDRTESTTGADCFNCPGAQWTGTDSVLKTYNYSLNSIGSETNVIFRIVFDADDAINQEGVIVDDFLISGTLANQNFELNKIVISPNPSTGIFTIFSNNLALDKLEVYDITGKIIVSKRNLDTTNSTLDLTNVSTGIYFVKMVSNNQSTVKRIIKN